MVGANTEVKFLVSTQEDHNTPGHKWRQISSARSYLATRSHAQRRSKIFATTGAEDEEHNKSQSATSRTTGSDGASVQSQFVRIAPQPANTNTVSKELHEEREHNPDISLQDLVDIFRPFTTREKNSLQNATKVIHSSDLAPPSLKLLAETTKNEDSTSCSHIESKNLQKNISTTSHPASGSYSQALSLTDKTAETQPVGRAILQTHYPDTAPSIPIVPDSTTSLCPFVHLPVEVTSHEKSLIHFYLVCGRCWLLGTSENAKFCPAIALSQLLLQVDSIYVLAHIIIGELLLSKATQRPLGRSYYKRCAEVYKATNVLLLDQDVSIHQKLWTLIQLAMLEATARRSDLQALHVKALDEFAESRGGITAAFEDNQEDCFSYVTSRLYAGPLVWAPIPILFMRRLELVKARFLKSLGEIQTWVSAFHAWTSSPDSAALRSDILSHRQLDTITAYLRNLVGKWRSAEIMSMSLETKSGALFCGLSLARTFVECDCSPAAAFDFLYEAQESLRCSTTASPRQGHELDDLHPAASAYGISCTRSKLFTDDDPSREARISQALSDAHKLFMLLTVTRRIQIVEWVTECVTMVGMLANDGPLHIKPGSVLFESQQLQTLGEEIDRAWKAANAADKR